MPPYALKSLERLASYIDNLVATRGRDIYWENRNRHEPRLSMYLQGVYPEQQPLFNLGRGDEELESLFLELIDPNRITGTVRRGGGIADQVNLIWDDICRNGLGPNQLDRIAEDCRGLCLEHYLEADPTYSRSLEYLRQQATSATRARAIRDWVGFLANYALKERFANDEGFRSDWESLIGIKVGEVVVPEGIHVESILAVADDICESEMRKVVASGDYSSYTVRLDLLTVFEYLGTCAALDRVRERRDDPEKHSVVKEKAQIILRKIT